MRRLGRGGFYNPKSKGMAVLKTKVKDGIPNPPIFTSAVCVDIKVFMRRPNTHFKCDDRSKSLKTGLPILHTIAPDIDNLVKFVLDALNKLVYQDDKQCVKLTAIKLYDSEGGCDGRTVVKVTEFGRE